MPYCANCGAQNEADAAFCESCGARLEVGGPPPPSQRPAGGGARWAALGGLVALIALVVGGVLAYVVLTGDEEDTQVVAGPSPTVQADSTATAVAPSATASTVPEPTATPVPTEAPQPTATAQPTAAPPPPTAVPPPAGYATPEEALRAYIEQYGGRYAGDCEFANIETDVGAFCTSLYEDRGQTLIYAAGLTFSEYGVWVLVVDQGGGWLVLEEADMVPAADGSFVPPW